MKVLLVYLNKRTDNQKLMNAAPLTLPLLAAYTPPDIEVSIVDEAFETIDYDTDADLV
ncbi:MAG: B12-binding domain-containing radical SAM protein, partial [Deltaproteobacteria bacterium]|nr:B12-binding domain-containing radical SAM protein [Deltaproteobacteria bacterium]